MKLWEGNAFICLFLSGGGDIPGPRYFLGGCIPDPRSLPGVREPEEVSTQVGEYSGGDEYQSGGR